MEVANPKWVDPQQLSFIKNSQSLSSAHLQSWCAFPPGWVFSSGANSTNTVHATGKNQMFETRARRVTVDVILREKLKETCTFSQQARESATKQPVLMEEVMTVKCKVQVSRFQSKNTPSTRCLYCFSQKLTTDSKQLLRNNTALVLKTGKVQVKTYWNLD